MKPTRRTTPTACALLLAGLTGSLAACAPGAATGPGRTLTGAAILDHPCGKVSVKQMGLIHAGNADAAVALGTPELQQEWRALPADERTELLGLMGALSQSAEDHAADIAAHGRLAVTGDTATLTIIKSRREPDVSSTETFTQRFSLNGTGCAIAR